MLFGGQTFTSDGTPPTISLDSWQLIGFTVYLNADQKSSSGTIFCGSSSSHFTLDNQATAFDLSTASVIRVGDSSNSFNGQISLVRITTPGGGVIRNSNPYKNFKSLMFSHIADLCSSDNSLELGLGSFPLACSGANSLNTLDNTCYATCPDGTFSTSAPEASLCGKELSLCPLLYLEIVPCPDGCTTCDSKGCLSCISKFIFYQGECVRSCPDGTYSDGKACQGR